MEESTIFSIGHGNKKIEEFIDELKSLDVKYLLDIRSKPYSKWSPQFNQSNLEMELKNNGISYVFVGDALGGLPEDKSCYDHNGKVVYDLIKEKDFFKKGLARIVKANERAIRLAIMCSEAKPEECHRSKLIGQELMKQGIAVKHIVAVNKMKPQQMVMNELTKGRGTIDLFGNKPAFTSVKTL